MIASSRPSRGVPESGGLPASGRDSACTSPHPVKGASMKRRSALSLILAALVLTVCVPLAAPAPRRTPKLVVILVVDQMRADYVEKFGQNWTGGLRRLMEEGAWF